MVRYFSVGQSWKGWVHMSLNKLVRRRFISAYQKEAVNKGDSPQVN